MDESVNTKPVAQVPATVKFHDPTHAPALAASGSPSCPDFVHLPRQRAEHSAQVRFGPLTGICSTELPGISAATVAASISAVGVIQP